MNDDDDEEQFENYTERAAETLAYRLMEYLEFLGVITAEHVNYLLWPPFELIEDAELSLAGLTQCSDPDVFAIEQPKANPDLVKLRAEVRAAIEARGWPWEQSK